jgi:hypothetical protein
MEEACAQSKCRLSRSMSELIEGIVMKQKAMHALTKAAVRFVCRPCTMLCVCIASLLRSGDAFGGKVWG